MVDARARATQRSKSSGEKRATLNFWFWKPSVELRVLADDICPARVRHEVELRRHARHGVDLAGELRDQQRLHHRAAGEADVHRPIDRNGKLVKGRDVLVRVDEQPFPVEPHRLNLERRSTDAIGR